MNNLKNPYDKLYIQINYQEKPFGYKHDYFKWRTNKTKGVLGTYIKHNGLVLDVGGGAGAMTEYLPDFVTIDNYFNLDVSFIMLKYCNYQNILAAAEYIPFMNDTFDYIVSSEALEHVNNKIQTLSECYRVLKEGGLLLLSTPRTGWMSDYMKSPFYPFVMINSLINKLRRNKPELIIPEGVKDEASDESWIRDVLSDIGFEILHQTRVDNHVPWGKAGESRIWRWFADSFVDSQKYGHCTLLVCRK